MQGDGSRVAAQTDFDAAHTKEDIMVGLRSTALMTALFLTSACAVNDQNVTRAQGAGAGAALGAGLGLLFGGDTEGALIGAAAGGLAGLAAGEAVARKKADYASKEDMIVQERRIVSEKSAEVRAYNEGLKQELDTLNQDIARLETEVTRGHAERNTMIDLRARAEAELDQAHKRLAQVNREIDVSRKVYLEALRESEPVDLVQWERRIQELQRRRNTLAALIIDFDASTKRIAAGGSFRDQGPRSRS